MFRFPDVIQISVLDSMTGEAVPNIAVKIHLSALQRNDYDFLLPTSDDQGIIKIRQGWLTDMMDGGINHLVADQASALDDLYPRLDFEVLPEEDVDSRLEKLSEQQQYGENLSRIDELANAVNSAYLPVRYAVDLNDQSELKVIIRIQPKP